MDAIKILGGKPARAILAALVGLSSDWNLAVHDTLTIGDDVYEFLDSSSKGADTPYPERYTLTADGNIPVEYTGWAAELPAAINGTRSGYPVLYGTSGYLLSDGMTPAPFVNGTERLFAEVVETAALNASSQQAYLILLTSADAPGGTLAHRAAGLALGTSNARIVAVFNDFGGPSGNVSVPLFAGAVPTNWN